MTVQSIAHASTQQDTGRPSGLVHRWTVVGVALGLALIALLIWRSDPPRTWGEIQSVDPLPLLLALALDIPVVLLRTLRARAVVATLGHHVPFRRMVLIQLVGQTLSGMTPAASGDLIRAYLWRRSDAVPGSHGVAAVVFERVYSFVLLTSVGLTLVLTFVLGGGGTVLGLAVVALVLVMPWVLARLPETLERTVLHRATTVPGIGRLAGSVEQGFDATRRLLRSGAFLVYFGFLTLLLFAINGAQLWLLLTGLGANVALTTAVGVFALAQTGGTLSTLPFALGSMEVLMAGSLVRTGVSIGDAAPAALLLRVVMTLPLAVAAVIAYVLLERERSRQELSRTAELG